MFVIYYINFSHKFEEKKEKMFSSITANTFDEQRCCGECGSKQVKKSEFIVI
jgi:hypothetical protein